MANLNDIVPFACGVLLEFGGLTVCFLLGGGDADEDCNGYANASIGV